ncbi:poly(rC)-binding protein 3-like isoform X2 [Haliotis rufescens]|uniref:poly(rC)-binding protein 3-like isoform X2 n=1 Tax=Haliotis rufescens TaxID=6454 RepID=UPI001EB0864C|nr:poly(rC)-binding protein 3-like isoform X2 [Haliotis rufescens]
MATEKTMVQNDTNSSTILTIRMIMQGKEVGSIIGKKGDNIKKFREDSGAKINISDGSCPERIVTITGSTDNIHKAFTMICKKFEEDLQNTPTVPKPPVTLRLVVPASQCGSLIGKGGCKIKEIRESTGASIQVASEMLPNSTERAVTISGTADAITQCIRNICGIMLESPPKGANIPYRPKPVVSPVIFAGGQAYTVQNQLAPVPSPECPPLTRGIRPQVGYQNIMDMFGAAKTAPQMMNKLAGQHMAMAHPVPMIPTAQTVLPGGCMAMNGLTTLHFARPNNTAAAVPNNQQTHEMTIPNDLIGCIIGRGGQKINEIRQLSGATIKISNAEEGSADRKVTISGAPETIGLAQYLINTSMEMHKTLTLDPTSNPTTSSLTSVQSHAPLAIPLSQLMKPVPMLGLNMGVLDASADRKNLMPKMRVGVTANTMKKAERPKFAPY